MALAITQLNSNSNTTSGTKSTTTTPAAGSLPIIITWHSGNTSSAAPTDNQTGGTYSLLRTITKNAGADTMAIWARDAFATAVSTVFTHAPGTTTGGGIVVLQVTGMTKVGAAAMRQSASDSNGSGGITPAATFGTAPLTSNGLIGAVFNGTNPATMTPPSSFGELSDDGYAVPATGLEVCSVNSGVTGATINWGSSSASGYAALVVEISADSANDARYYYEMAGPNSV